MDVATGALIVLLLAMAMAAWWLISVNEPKSSGLSSPADAPPRNDPQLRIDQMPEWEQIVRGEKICCPRRKTPHSWGPGGAQGLSFFYMHMAA